MTLTLTHAPHPNLFHHTTIIIPVPSPRLASPRLGLAARTNIKYVVNQFRIKKAMERAVLLAFDRDGVDPSKLDDAAEVGRFACV